MFHLTREPSKERRPHLEACACLIALSCCCANDMSKIEAAAKKKFLVVPNDFTLREMQITGVPGTSGAAGILEKGAQR